MQGSSSLFSSSPDRFPSFDTYYSSGRVAQIAARVVQEFKNETDSDSIFHDLSTESCKGAEQENHVEENNDNDDVVESDGEFEFSIVNRDQESIPITAEEIFYDGRIMPVYPLFNTDLLSSDLGPTVEDNAAIKTKAKSHRPPLRQLFSEDREVSHTSCSSSEAEELDGAEPGTYCVWTPKKAGESSLVLSKKSSSTGTSKRWKFRDFLYRSHSDGSKDTLVFPAPINSDNKVKTEEPNQRTTVFKAKGGFKDQYVKRNGAVKESQKRRSYLPYRQDLVGVFAYMNRQSRNLNRY